MSRMGGFLQLLLETCFHNEIKLLLIVVHDEFGHCLFIYFVFYGISCDGESFAVCPERVTTHRQ